uniref:Zinc finger PMZ-type domain-containing protein n=1 Tax=Tanacetum cinerariifolium TaxID=118510 RepID=A0A6L2LUT8_TANCI|nr:hypothetical protein [Tanacetum cinerariifolium]
MASEDKLSSRCVNNDHVLYIYASHAEFKPNDTTIEQNLGGNDQQNNESKSDLEDDDYNVYDYYCSEESDIASIDHLSDGEEEVLDVRTKNGWQLAGLPCEHRFAVIYFLHKDPEEYISKGYRKERFMSAYNHYIEGMNGMNQWPSTSHQTSLPQIKRRIPRRPPHKRNRDAFKNDEEGSASGVNTPNRSVRGGTRSTKGDKTSSVSSIGGKKSTNQGKKSAIKVSTPSSPTVGFEVSISGGVGMRGAGVRMTTNGVRIRGGAYIRVRCRARGDGSRSRMYLDGIRPIGYDVSWDPIDGETILGNNMGLPRLTWLARITQKDVKILAES